MLFAGATMLFIGCGGGGGGMTTTTTTDTNTTTCVLSAPELPAATIQEYLDAINAARSVEQDCGSEGIFPPADPLTWNESLYNAAYEHSRDLALSDTFSHEGSGTLSDITATDMGLDYSMPPDRIEHSCYTGYVTVGENVAAGTAMDTPQKAVVSWLDSPSHCAALMNPDFKEVGMGHYEDAEALYTHYWTQNFGAK